MLKYLLHCAAAGTISSPVHILLENPHLGLDVWGSFGPEAQNAAPDIRRCGSKYTWRHYAPLGASDAENNICKKV